MVPISRLLKNYTSNLLSYIDLLIVTASDVVTRACNSFINSRTEDDLRRRKLFLLLLKFLLDSCVPGLTRRRTRVALENETPIFKLFYELISFTSFGGLFIECLSDILYPDRTAAQLLINIFWAFCLRSLTVSYDGFSNWCAKLHSSEDHDDN